MTNIARTFFAVGLSLLVTACATIPNIVTDSDPAQDFSSYSKFAWASDNPMIAVGDHNVSGLVQKEIADSIKTTLASRGYQYVTDVQSADFAISYTVGARDKVSVSTYPDFFFADRLNWGWGNQYFRPYRSTIPVDRTVVRNYTEGTLSIDIYDVTRKSPVWHGKGEKRLSRKEMKGEDIDILTDVQAILAGFPPQ